MTQKIEKEQSNNQYEKGKKLKREKKYSFVFQVKLNQLNQTLYKQQLPVSVTKMSMKDSFTSATKFQSRESLFIERLNEPMSENSVKQFSNMTLTSHPQKSKTLKVKKIESLSSNSTDQDQFVEEQAKFINSYKNDLIFRKKVDFLIKQHEKRMKQIQENHSNNILTKNHINFTWRTQRHCEEMKVVELYEKCKKWMNKANENR